MNQAAVTKALQPKTYEEAWISIYNGPHLGGHMALAMMVRKFPTNQFKGGDRAEIIWIGANGIE